MFIEIMVARFWLIRGTHRYRYGKAQLIANIDHQYRSHVISLQIQDMTSLRQKEHILYRLVKDLRRGLRGAHIGELRVFLPDFVGFSVRPRAALFENSVFCICISLVLWQYCYARPDPIILGFKERER